jgi:hypothetical protein
MRLLFPPFSLPKLYNSAGSRYNHIFPVNGAALAAGLHSTFSLSIGNFYLEDLRRSKSTLGYFEHAGVPHFRGISVAQPAGQRTTNESSLGGKMKIETIKSRLPRWALIVTITAATAGCAGGPLTSREKGAGIGALGGAAAGAAIGSAFHRPGMGAAIGAGTGLGAGALIGDYMQGQQER